MRHQHDKIMTGYSLRKWVMGNDLKDRIYAVKKKSCGRGG